MTYRLRVIPKKKRRTMQRAIQRDTTGRTTYDFEVIEAPARPLIRKQVFSDLPAPVLAAFDAVSLSVTYPKEATLFVEGQEASGVFVVCQGRVKLSANSADGKSIMVRMAEPGELVGVPGTLLGKAYELTAEALEPVHAKFIPRDAFVQFLREHGEAALRVAETLSHIYNSTLLEVRYLGFSGSTTEKLARFLLDLPATPCYINGHLRATLRLTHKEIADIIGSSRETVTRLFAHFKRERLIEVHGSTLLITDKSSIEKLLEG
jgi:CRP/FNR family transcriptional regulator, cyclic AMP receptor protein